MHPLDAYQAEAIKLAVFKNDIGIMYCTLKLNGESGEVAEKLSDKLSKIFTYTPTPLTVEARNAIALELGDVLWYIANLAHQFGYKLSEIYNRNTDSATVYENTLNAAFLGLRLNYVAGRLAERIGKLIRDQDVGHTNTAILAVPGFAEIAADDLNACLRFLGNLAEQFNFTPQEIADMNLAKLADRRKRNTIKGSGDNR